MGLRKPIDKTKWEPAINEIEAIIRRAAAAEGLTSPDEVAAYYSTVCLGLYARAAIYTMEPGDPPWHPHMAECARFYADRLAVAMTIEQQRRNAIQRRN